MHIKFWRFVDTFSSFELDSLSFDFCWITHWRISYTDVYTCPFSQITAITASWQPLPDRHSFTRLVDFILLHSYLHILLQYNNCANETQRRASNKHTFQLSRQSHHETLGDVWPAFSDSHWPCNKCISGHVTTSRPLLLTASSQLT